MTSSSFFCGMLFCNCTDVDRGSRSLVNIADNVIGLLISPAEMDNKEPGLIEKAVMCDQFEKFHSPNKSARSLIDLCHLLNIRTHIPKQVDDNKIWVHPVLE